MKTHGYVALFLVSSLALSLTAADAEDVVKPDALVVEPPTLLCLGFQWFADGDDNGNATVALEFRAAGQEDWRQGMDLLRVHYSGDEDDVPPMFAGSILDLEPGTEYECRLALEDPDGVEGDATRKVKVSTREEAEAWEEGPVRHVHPADYRGEIPDGAYYGLLAAFRDRPGKRGKGWGAAQGPAEVEPGTIFEVHAGTYKAERYHYRDDYFLIGFGTYHIAGLKGTAEKPIVIRPAGDGEVVFDGAGCFRLFDFRTARHLVFEGFTVQNTEFGVWLGDFGESIWAEDITIRDCTFREVTHGVMGRHPRGRNYTITDNRFIGRGPMGQNVEANIAVEVGGKGHVIAHNYCERFFDFYNGARNGEVTYSYMYVPGQDSAIDLYNNDLRQIKDNALCTGGRVHNIRFLRNRVINQGGATLAPYGNPGGPVYWIRNVTHGAKGFKSLRNGNLAYHNTCDSGPTRWTHDHSAYVNNVWLAERARRDKRPQVLFPLSGARDHVMGYNAWFLPREDAIFAAARGDRSWKTLREFQQAQDRHCEHAVMVEPDDFRRIPETWVEYGGQISPENLDLRPKPDSPVVDAALPIPNVNDDCVGRGPDIGAYELGKPLPHYGPRTPAKTE